MPNIGTKPILISVAGGIFLYSGIKGLSISTTLRDLVSGTNPADSVGLATHQDNPQVPSPRIVHPGKPHPGGANRISPKAIYRYARQAGFSASAAVIATAVALAESGGNTNAHCLNCVPGVTEDSRGLWQINVDAHPWALTGDLYDPQTNAAAAFQISNQGRNFGPWSTYTNGAYRSHLSQAMKAAG